MKMTNSASQPFDGQRRRAAGANTGMEGLTLTFDPIEEFDRQLLCFVASWAPYGGPPVKEVLPRFGIRSDQIGQRIREIAKRYHHARIVGFT